MAPELAGKAGMVSLPPLELIRKLEKGGARHIYLDGGNTIQRLLRESLVDKMTITRSKRQIEICQHDIPVIPESIRPPKHILEVFSI